MSSRLHSRICTNFAHMTYNLLSHLFQRILYRILTQDDTWRKWISIVIIGRYPIRTPPERIVDTNQVNRALPGSIWKLKDALSTLVPIHHAHICRSVSIFVRSPHPGSSVGRGLATSGVDTARDNGRVPLICPPTFNIKCRLPVGFLHFF